MGRQHPVSGSEAVAYILKVADHMSQARRESLSTSQFAVPAPKAKKLGVGHEIKGEAKGKYPIPDLKHARNALARVSQHGSPGEREAVRGKVYAKYPELKEGFQESHGGESPTAKVNIKKQEQGGVGKEGCAFKTAAIEHLSGYLGHIAAKLAPTTQTMGAALSTMKPAGLKALRAIPSAPKLPTSALGLETLRKTSSALFDELQKIALVPQLASSLAGRGVSGAAHLVGGKGEAVAKALSGLKPRAGATPLATAQRELGGFRSLAGGGPIMPGGQLVKGSSMEKEEGLWGKLVGKGSAPAVRTARQLATTGGEVGIPTHLLSRAPAVPHAARPIGSLQQNIAERGISL